MAIEKVKAYFKQLGGGVVIDFAFVVDDFGDGFGERRVEVDALGKVVEERVADGVVTEEETEAVGYGVERAAEVEEGFEFDDGVGHAETNKLGGEVDEILRRERVFEDEDLAEFLGLLDFADDMVVVVGEGHFVHHADGKFVGAFGGEEFAYFGKT